MKLRRWTKDEDAMLGLLVGTHTLQRMAEMLDRTVSAVDERLRKVHPGSRPREKTPQHFRPAPIGTQSMRRDGLMQKVSETPGKRWKLVCVIEWETLHGPVPPGHKLVRKDRTKPPTVDNLQLGTNATLGKGLAEQMAKTDPELRELHLIKRSINNAVKRLEKAESL